MLIECTKKLSEAMKINLVPYEETKADPRSVLGQMKEFDISISWKIEDHILRNTINLVSLNRWIGRNMMCGTLDYAHLIDLLRMEFEDVFGGLNYL